MFSVTRVRAQDLARIELNEWAKIRVNSVHE